MFDFYDDLVEAKTLFQLTNTLNRAFKQHRITFTGDSVVKPTAYFKQSAIQSGILEGNAFPNGEITIVLWSEAVKCFSEDDEQFKIVSQRLSEVIHHELVHREQAARSNFTYLDQNPKRDFQKLGEWQQYYADPHENLAFSHEILEQLYQRHITKSAALQLLVRGSRMLYQASPRYTDIRETVRGIKFEYSIVNRLHKNLCQILVS